MSSCRGRRASPIVHWCVLRWPRDRVSCVERFSPTTTAMLGVLDGLGISTRADEATATIEVDGCGGHLPGAGAHVDANQSGTTARLRCRSQRSARCRSSSTLTRRCGVAPWGTSSPLCGRWGSRSPNWASPIDCRLASRVRSTGPRHRCRAIRRASSSLAYCTPVGRRRCRWPSPPNRFLGPTSR